ncbi:PEP-CTERM sorting domain-containing protein [Alteromonas sp. A081]|uniref:PEP-CTERM sorting domain-containing protein n=1 Tax=Alteromonas sp. A081 TaxID=3410269 RepID=UPI003B98482B
MKNLTKIVAGLALLGSAAVTSASPLFIDNGVNGDSDADTRTDTFLSFVFNQFNPTSAYLDLEGDGISTGTLVFDSGTATIGSLSPLAFGSSQEGFNGAWGLSIEYELFGFAAIADDVNGNGFFEAGDTLAAQFVDGFLNMNYVDANGSTPFLQLDVTGSAFNINQGVNFSIFGQPTSASNILNTEEAFFGSTGFGDAINNLDPVNIGALASLLIGDATQAPTANNNFPVSTFQQNVLDSLGLSTLPQTAQWLTRTTSINTASLTLEVPAPSSLAIFGLGLLGLGFSRRLKSK